MKLKECLQQGKVYFIAEMSANHAGKLEYALELVHKAKEAGADCLKIQTYTADTITLDCKNKYFMTKGGLWDGCNLYDLYQKAYTPWEWQAKIKKECEACNLDFLSSPFDETAVDFLESIGCEAYKIASFELNHIPLIQHVAKTGKPLVMSTGIASLEDISTALNAARAAGAREIYLLKCSSIYPAKYEELNYACIPDMKARFSVPVGASDHTLGTIAAIVAAIEGACIIEKHLCLSRKISTPDCEFSMEPKEFAKMVEDVKAAKQAIGTPTYELPEREKRQILSRRSIFVSADIKKGEIFTTENIRIVRPGNGMAPALFPEILGNKASRNLTFGEPLHEEDVSNFGK